MESEPDPQPDSLPNSMRAPIKHFVTTIKNAEQQVGENIIRALSEQGTVAALTTLVQGPDGTQHLVTAALGDDMMAQVRRLLSAVQEEQMEEVMCVGFHCMLPTNRTDSDGSENP